MSDDLRSITLKTIPDAIRLLNESSQGTSLEYHLEFFSFLGLKRFWDFSPSYSLIRYVDNQPAAIALNCADPQAHAAYNFYWGALPQFRSAKLSLSLFETCCQKLHHDGYVALFGDAIPERPLRRYRFIQALPQHGLLDMKATSAPRLPTPDPEFEVRKLAIDAVTQLPGAPGEIFHWTQRPSFLRNIEFCSQFLGAFRGDAIEGYAVFRSKPDETVVFDLRSPSGCVPAGYELLRFIGQNYAPPISALHVFDGSYSHRLLSDAGFIVTRRFSTLYRDLATTCRNQVA